MAILDTINKAREQGASDSDILAEVARQNPDKEQSLNEAIKRGATPNAVLSEIEKQNKTGEEPEEQKLNFAQRVGQDLQKRIRMAEEISEAVVSGEQSFAEGILQVAGKVGVGGFFDLVGEGIVSAARGLSAITPDIIKNPVKNLAGAALTQFLNTNTGKVGLAALEKGQEFYGDFKQGNPRAARNIEAIVDIGLLFAPVKAKAKPAPETIVGEVAGKLEAKAVVQEAAKKKSFIEGLVRPAPTKAVREAEVGRTAERGILKTKEIAPSVTEKRIAEEVSKIEGVSSKKTIQGNYNTIAEANTKLAKQLEADIAKNDFIYSKKQLVSELNKAKIRLGENPLIVGDAEKVAEKLLTKFEQIIAKNEGNGSGILKSRKEFDAWVKSQKGTNIFDPKNENALSIALREIRKTANDFLDKNAKDVAVKESLKRQSNLFRAMENITPKAAEEGGNIAIRAWQNILRVLPFRGEFNQVLAVLFGLGGLGASAVFAPFFTKIVLGSLFIYSATKAVTGPTTKKALSHLLKGVDQAIRKTKDANLIGELRVDRAALLELLEVVNQEEEE